VLKDDELDGQLEGVTVRSDQDRLTEVHIHQRLLLQLRNKNWLYFTHFAHDILRTKFGIG